MDHDRRRVAALVLVLLVFLSSPGDAQPPARIARIGPERLPHLAGELVRLNVDLIVAASTEAVHAARKATRTIPIVMAFSGDPIGSGFVAGLARPVAASRAFGQRRRDGGEESGAS